MSIDPYKLTPWSDVIRPHQDIIDGTLDMAAYAADLGGVDRGDPGVPSVYRNAHEFFRTTYVTRNLRRLLQDVMSVVAGGNGDRVIQLRTPFGGGKTHSLLALYHLMKDRSSIDPELLKGISDPGPGRVVVLSGIDLDPVKPRTIEGLQIHTLWGELAYRLDGTVGYEKVREHDEGGSAPGGDTLRDVIGERPTLILLDEVLVYVESAGGANGDHPRRRQSIVFLQKLTEVVRNLSYTAMIYSLQASTHEAAGDEALLTELEKLVTRVDAKREPVADDELTRVVQRRLFPDFGNDPQHERVAAEVAREYALAYRRTREAFGQTTAEKRGAGPDAERFERRIVESYPFHPELLDLMYHRWGSLPSYQRTRGALQFLARVVHGVWDGENARQPLIGPGDVPLEDELVRGAFFSQIGQPREQYTSVLSADVVGQGARARIVDDRLSADSPRYKELHVGTRVATAIMLYSFGARESEEPGIIETDLIQALTSPDLDRNVLTATLSDLRDQLLYLHYSGRRYRFEPKANLNLLLSEEMKKVSADEVRDRIRSQLAALLRSAADRALLWPSDSSSIPDHDPIFRIVYLDASTAELEEPELTPLVEDFIENDGQRRRDYKNALAFAVPGRASLDRARTAGRMLLALQALDEDVKAKRVTVETEQRDDITDRRRAANAELEASTDGIYQQLLLPVSDRSGDRPYRLELIDLRAQLSAGRDLHERLMGGLRKFVFDTVTPARLATLTRLGEDREWVACKDLADWFFAYLEFPKLTGVEALKTAIAAGTYDTFGYVAAAVIEGDRLSPTRPELVRMGQRSLFDEIDLGPGTFVVAPELARTFVPEENENPPLNEPTDGPAAPTPERESRDESTAAGPTLTYHRRLALSAQQLFRILPALQNLADRADEIHFAIEIEAEAAEGFDDKWLRNAVEEHFEEAGIEAGEHK